MITTGAHELEEKICSYMEEHKMLLPGERVVAGISGGADSVCLLFVLLEWRRRHGLELAAVHVDHGIRREAARDAQFVRELCGRLEVPFYLREGDIPRLAQEEKCSLEEAGRNYRYQAFEQAAEEFGADKIAVAHNLNDCCETMLFHLFRGSGLRGLCGIPPVRGRIIRPLLCVERREIENYLGELGQGYCRDATNDGDEYTRNRIRHHILPCAEKDIAPGCTRRMGQTAELLAETEDYLKKQTEDAMVRCGGDRYEKESCGYSLDCEVFLTLHPAIQKRVLYELIKKLSPKAKDISRRHVEEVRSLFMREGNRQICLPFGIRVRREYGKVFLGMPAGERMDEMEYQAQMRVIPVGDLPRDKENLLIFPQNLYTKWFDYDKMKKCPVLRTRAPGDYLTIRDARGQLHHKKLQDYMVTEKIPANIREKVPVLAEDSHILWLAGYRISEYYKVNENTKRILQVQLVTDCGDSDTEEKNVRAHQGIIAGSGGRSPHTADWGRDQ